MKNVWTGLALLMAVSVSTIAVADSAPVQFSSLNGFNAPANDTVVGVRFPALWGKTATVKGVDFHLLAIAEADDFTGLQFPLLFVGANHINNSMTGLSLGLWNWNKGQTTGVNWSAVNIANDVNGANLGFANVSSGDTLVDLGAGNVSKASTVQLGVFNMTDEIKGAQIGLLNCAKNGFLPCFPFVNFAVK